MDFITIFQIVVGPWNWAEADSHPHRTPRTHAYIICRTRTLKHTRAMCVCYTRAQVQELQAGNETLMREMKRVLGETTPEVVGLSREWGRRWCGVGGV